MKLSELVEDVRLIYEEEERKQAEEERKLDKISDSLDKLVALNEQMLKIMSTDMNDRD